MISEGILEKHYEQIAEKLDELIPIEWDRIVMYGEEIGDASAICIYYYTDNCTKVHHSGNIPEEFNVDEHIVDLLENELMDINKNLWLEFKKAGEPTWCSLTFYLENTWQFKIKYGYERDAEIGHLGRVIRWAYDELGIIPKDDYEKKLLDEYLESQK